jgi:hypothetical protein
VDTGVRSPAFRTRAPPGRHRRQDRHGTDDERRTLGSRTPIGPHGTSCGPGHPQRRSRRQRRRDHRDHPNHHTLRTRHR